VSRGPAQGLVWVLVRAGGFSRDGLEGVLGDLEEEGLEPGTWRHLRALAGVALHVHGEPYRDREARGWLLLAAAGGLLLWSAVVAASFPPMPDLEPLWDPVSRMALRFWSASHLTAALAAGLFVGHLPGAPQAAEAGRWHACSMVIAVAAWQGQGVATALMAAAALLVAAWIGARARVDRARGRAAGPA